MPLNIPAGLPAISILEKEHIFVKNSIDAARQDIRPLKIAILNLMPIKITTETDLIRLLSNTPLQVEIDFIRLESHTSKNTPVEHMMAFYKSFEELKSQHYDGMIVTGAPVENLEYEEVNYWVELTKIFDWSRSHVTSTLYICWGALAGLYYFYGIPKIHIPAKMFGIFPHKILAPANPIFRGFDDVFNVPHSRHVEISRADVDKVKDLQVLAESEDAGVYMLMARDGREIFVTGHAEYAPDTLDGEYKRDLSKGLPIDMPKNYYREDNPKNGVMVTWRSHANLFYANWLNYFVYQTTPFNIDEIK